MSTASPTPETLLEKIAIEAKDRKKPLKLNKEVLNLIRTSMRNHIDLTQIADNKANVLLSLNALMITFSAPFVLPYTSTIIAYKLYIPIAILVMTSLITIYTSILALKPGKFNKTQGFLTAGKIASPFFFGNFYAMSKKEYQNYLMDAMTHNETINEYVTEDLYYLGLSLSRKMILTRRAFSIFTYGFFAAVLMCIVCVVIYITTN